MPGDRMMKMRNLLIVDTMIVLSTMERTLPRQLLGQRMAGMI